MTTDFLHTRRYPFPANTGLFAICRGTMFEILEIFSVAPSHSTRLARIRGPHPLRSFTKWYALASRDRQPVASDLTERSFMRT